MRVIAGRLSVLLANLHPRLFAVGFVAICAVPLACRSHDEARSNPPLSTPVQASAIPVTSTATPAMSGNAAVAAPSPVAVALACPSGQRLIPGGKTWIGSDPKEHFSDDESPRFLTELAPFCLDETEVTVAAYRACVAKGVCTKPIEKQFHCNFHYSDREDHPINCVTWPQANGFCEAQGERLPSEAEWEYAARGGEQYREYSWGKRAARRSHVLEAMRTAVR